MRYAVFILFSVFLAFASTHAFAAGTESTGSSEASDIRSARAALKNNQYAEAEGLLRKAVIDNPGSADAWNLLGYSTRKQGKLVEAEEYYGKALKLDSKHTGAMEYLGILYVKTGRLDEARALLARIDKACLFSCDEYDDLKKAIETGKGD